MQKLRFESSWKNTISVKDRNQIEQAFSDIKIAKNERIHLSPLWQAMNHKEQLLVTVIVHNSNQETLSFHNTKLRYLENNKLIAEHSFTLPSLIIEPQTSMPWTFIFPVESFCSQPTLENGTLEMAVLE